MDLNNKCKQNALKYIEELEKALECKVCGKVAVDPLTFANCRHFFCKSCIDFSRNNCVVCGVPSFAKDVVPDLFVRNVTVCAINIKQVLIKDSRTTENTPEKAYSPEKRISETEGESKKTRESKEEIKSRKSSRKSASENKAKLADKGDSKSGKSAPESKPTLADKGDSKSSGKSASESKPKLADKGDSKYSEKNESTKPPKTTQVPEPIHEKSKRFLDDKSKKNGMYTTPTKKLKTSSSDASHPKNPTHSTKKSANKRNMKGETPLHIACIKGNILQVETLIDNGANPNVKDNFGWTPLHEAIHHKKYDIAKLLLERGRAWVNTPGGENVTALHTVAAFNLVEGAKLLIEWGANPKLMDIYGRRPLDIATSDEVMKIMESSLTAPRKCIVTNPMLNDTYEQDEHFVFLGDDLSKNDQKLLAKLLSIIPSAKIAKKFSSDVTHIVVNVDSGICTPTLNVLSGILAGKLIVSMDWVGHSIKKKSVKHDHNFGVKGTKNYPESNGLIKSRLSNKIMLPSLFSGMHFCISSSFRNLNYENLKKEDLINLVILGAGRYLSREPDPEAISSSEMTVPFHANNSIIDIIDVTSSPQDIISKEAVLNKQLGADWRKCLSGLDEAHPMKKCSHVILYHQENSGGAAGASQKEKSFLRYNMAHLKTLPVTWLIGCIESFTLLDPTPFI